VTRIEIRPYRSADFDAVTSLFVHSLNSTGVKMSIRKNITHIRREVRAEAAKDWSIHVAVVNTRIVGFVGFNGQELDELFVDIRFQGRGIGKQLLDFAKTVYSNGFWLRTQSQNVRARRFYEREGLKHIRSTVGWRPSYRIAWYEWRPSVPSNPRTLSASLRKQLTGAPPRSR
jgi:GNAT superfamily N-acetyltransferase